MRESGWPFVLPSILILLALNVFPLVFSVVMSFSNVATENGLSLTAATLSNWTEAGKSAVLQHLEGIEVPTFPISGADLIAKGMKPGPALGAELDRLETKWIASNFRLDRTQLLADVRT